MLLNASLLGSTNRRLPTDLRPRGGMGSEWNSRFGRINLLSPPPQSRRGRFFARYRLNPCAILSCNVGMENRRDIASALIQRCGTNILHFPPTVFPPRGFTH